MASNIIRMAIVKSIFKEQEVEGLAPSAAVMAYAKNRFGAAAEVTKALVNPATAASSALVAETLVRDEFVQAVFSGSILGKLQGIVEVPGMVRVNVESAPVTAPFVGEGMGAPAYAGSFGFVASNVRKVSIVGVFTEELLRATGDAAEAVVSGQLQRALSRGMDKAFTGAQARDAISPTGLSAVAAQVPAVTAETAGGATVVDTRASFDAGVLTFTGDLSQAAVLINPLTAITLRSPTEQAITATGGEYGGLPVVTSYAVPAGTLFIVDASRVLAYVGGATVEMSGQGDIVMDDGTGVATSTGTVHLFQEGKRGLKGTQYCDWDFVPGAAVEVALTA
jgi:hypothetical protein